MQEIQMRFDHAIAVQESTWENHIWNQTECYLQKYKKQPRKSHEN